MTNKGSIQQYFKTCSYVYLYEKLFSIPYRPFLLLSDVVAVRKLQLTFLRCSTRHHQCKSRDRPSQHSFLEARTQRHHRMGRGKA